jgi:hypothetical protein
MVKSKKILLKDFINWKSGLLVDILVALFLLFLNSLYLVPFFGQPDKSNVFSAPLFPLISYLTSRVTGLPMAKAITINLSLFVLLGPISLYFFLIRLAHRRLSGFFASLIYSLPTEWFTKGRIKMVFLVGDGGHIASLTLIPLVALFLLNFLRKGKFGSLVLASLGMGVIALASPFGLLVGVMVLTVIAFSEFLQGEGRLKIARFLVFIGLAVGLVAFWYNPGFVGLFLRSHQGLAIRKTFVNLIPISFVVVPILGAFGFLLFEKKAHLQPLLVVLGLAILFSLVSFANYVGRFFPSHPRRYLPALGFALSCLLGILSGAISDYLKFRGKLGKVRLTPLGRSLARKIFWLMGLGLMGVMVVSSLSSVWQLPESQVLGLWEEGATAGGFWEIKRQAGGISAGIGYGVTAFCLLTLIFSWAKIKKKQNLAAGHENKKFF